VICHLAALKVAQGMPDPTKAYPLSWSHLLIDNRNSSSRMSWSECCSPGRDELPISMSSHSPPIVLRLAVNLSRRSDRPEHKASVRKVLPLLSGICLCSVGVDCLCCLVACWACGTESVKTVDRSVRPVACCGYVGRSVRPVTRMVGLCGFVG
jgi:hypothetical protein